MTALDHQGERPSAPRRVKQVLEAAEKCFSVHGFHATSMAEIAAAAEMSVGHIYRYFACKDTLIAAILARDVHAAMADFDAVEVDEAGVFPAFFRHWRFKIEKMSERGRSTLWLEIMAEAARDPQAAHVVSDARAQVTQRLCALFHGAAPGRWSAEEMAAKVELVMLLTDAVAFKAIVDPDFHAARIADRFIDHARRIFEQA